MHTVARPGTRPEPSRPFAVVAALVAVLVAVAAWAVFRYGVLNGWHGWFDLEVYRGAVRAWWTGGLRGDALYDYLLPGTRYGFTYPPFAALVMLPLGAVGPLVAGVAHLAASVGLVVVGTVLVLGERARRSSWPAWAVVAVAVPLVLLTEPVRESLAFGQVNLFLAALVLADVVGLRRGARWAGVGTGLAVAVKLTPAVLVLYLLVTGRRRAAATAVGTAAAATVLAALVSPTASARYWTQALWDTGRVGDLDKTSNQSLLGLLARLTGDPADPPRALWLALAVAVVGLALVRAVQAHRRGQDLTGFVLVGVAGCLVSPISWTHHLWWLTLAVLLLAARGGRATGWAAGVAGTVLALGVVWWAAPALGEPHGTGPLTVLVENAYVWLALGVLVLLPTGRRESAVTG